MALSPTIPTSFVPKQPVAPGPVRPRNAGTNYFAVAGVILIIASFIAAGGIYLYSYYLQNVIKARAIQLQAVQSSISQDTVSQFVTLQNRLNGSKAILSQHVALSQFFSLLEQDTVTSVGFTSLTIQVKDDRTATVKLMGDAKDFNSLAAESTSFASNKGIQSAIFSGITVNTDNSIAFTIDANIDPSLIVESTVPATAGLITGTSTSGVIPATPTVTSASTTTP